MSDLYEKLRKIEALIQQGASDGERHAAKLAKKRLQDRIEDEPSEYQISAASRWEKRLLVAVCNKYGVKTYRYHRQKRTTTMVKVERSLMDEVLWPEYQRFATMLREMVSDVTDTLIDQVYNGEHEEDVVAGELAASS